MESQLERLKSSALNGSVAALQEFEQIAWRNPVVFSRFSVWPVISQVLDSDNVPQGPPDPARTNQILACISLLTTLLNRHRATQTPTLQPHDGSVLWKTIEIWSIYMAHLTGILGEEQTINEDAEFVNEVVIHLEELLDQATRFPGMAHYYAAWRPPRMSRFLSPLYSLLLRTMGSSHLYKPYKLIAVVTLFFGEAKLRRKITDEDVLIVCAYDKKISRHALLQIATAFNNNVLACEQENLQTFTTLVNVTFHLYRPDAAGVYEPDSVLVLMSEAFTRLLRTVSSRRTKIIKNHPLSWWVVLWMLLEIKDTLEHSGTRGLRASLGSSLLCALISIEIQIETIPHGHDIESWLECRTEMVNLIHYVKQFLVWPSLRKISSAQIMAVEKSGIERRLDPGTGFWSAWEDFKQAIVDLDTADAEIRYYFTTCHNLACPSTGVRKMQRCTRCYLAAYCSVVCQRDDWEDGHSAICANYLRIYYEPDERGGQELSLPTDVAYLQLRASMDLYDRMDKFNSLVRHFEAQQTDSSAAFILLLDYRDFVQTREVGMSVTTLEEGFLAIIPKRADRTSSPTSYVPSAEGMVTVLGPMGDCFSSCIETTRITILTDTVERFFGDAEGLMAAL
ncbi:hypothetical protein CYLTODRAFT_489052 [Cylindrobasidium torrendii FP15055 ss-10]|uniref:MYND-type domain-containing protein n=1 Tax=Cylindrobasidium torrendii FP15055 ss-10 TaxID=1314674 RepID=A0A0D7BHY0_9AGAR|nr:hypothetical protein CYLTODRAFT_489052 [Cylindrobasidium torrendii FP15055 ss-10]